jgi:hypothetical protein
VRKRFLTNIDGLMTMKASGRGKKATKVLGNLTNMSIGGGLIALQEKLKLEAGEEVHLSLNLENKKLPKAKNAKIDFFSTGSKVKAVVAWVNKNNKEIGLSFCGLSENQRKLIETCLRDAQEIL